ncbi:MAG: hypothetical protein IIV88_03065, partial [Erysipelotrichaceae bacterium]|nr:hypothetical protein [Erysipelotrichaceae bacterium]
INGFWLPADDRDIVRFVSMMNNRITDMQKAMKPAVEYLKQKNGGELYIWKRFQRQIHYITMQIACQGYCIQYSIFFYFGSFSLFFLAFSVRKAAKDL